MDTVNIDPLNINSDSIFLNLLSANKQGFDNEQFYYWISKSSYSYIKHVIINYQQSYNKYFLDELIAKTTGNYSRALKTFFFFIVDPITLYTYRIWKKSNLECFIMRLCLLRSEIDLKTIVHSIETQLNIKIDLFLQQYIQGNFANTIFKLLGKEPLS